MIKRIEIKHYKSLKDINLDFNFKNFYIVGKNGIGKSSLMDAIKISMGDTTCIPPNSEGRFDVFFSKDGKEIKSRVSILDGKPKIELHCENGDIFRTKEKIREIFGIVSFDIDEFLKLSKTKADRKKQMDQYINVLPLDDRKQINDLNSTLEHYSEVRTEIGREKNAKEGYLKSHKMFGNTVKYEKVDFQELIERKEKLLNFKNKLDSKKEKLTSNLNEIDSLKKRLEILEEGTNILISEINRGEEYLKGKDFENLNEKIKSIQVDNENYNLMEEFKRHENEYNLKVKEYDLLTETIESKRVERANFVKMLDSPVEGISFEEDYLTYNGDKVCHTSMCNSDVVKFGIEFGLAINPKQDIVFMEHAMELDEEKKKIVFDFCKEKGLQIFAEKIDKNDDINITEIIIE